MKARRASVQVSRVPDHSWGPRNVSCASRARPLVGLGVSALHNYASPFTIAELAAHGSQDFSHRLHRASAVKTRSLCVTCG